MFPKVLPRKVRTGAWVPQLGAAILQLHRRKIMEWVKERLKEPSSYAAIGAVVLGFGVLVDQPIIVVLGIFGGAAGFVLREKL